MKRREYTKEFKQEAVTLSNEQGVNAAQVARELGIEPALLYRWRAEMRSDGAEAFPGKGKLKSSDEEVRDLQRELDRVRMERDILKKALRVFARPES
jgi:transposase